MRPGKLIAVCAALAAAGAVAAPAHAATVTPPSSRRFTFDNTTQ